MRAVSKIAIVVAFFVIVSTVSAFGSATNIYITQSGSPTGNCTTNVQTPAFFNNAANWGTGASQIGPGTTVLFCGIFTGASGQTGFSFQGSGTSGNPITLRFDTSAQMSAPYWGSASSGAINCTSKGYLVVDGGTNGMIQNTANGTSLTYQQASHGWYSISCTNVTIKNLTVQNLYINQGSSSGATDTGGANTANVDFEGNSTNNQVFNNVLNNSRAGIAVNFDGGYDASNIQIYNNTISDHPWGIFVGANNASSTATGVVIHDNTISNWLNWQFPSSTYHTDGLILYNDIGVSAAYDTYTIYNNYFLGSLGNGSPTGYIACGVMSTCTIFNNLMVDTGSNGANGYIWLYSPNGSDAVYNNTLVGSSNGGVAITLGDTAGLGGATTSHLTVKNNIFTNVTLGLHDYQSLISDVTASNNNVWRTPSGAAPAMATNDSSQFSFATWQSDGFDVSSTNASPHLSGTYTLQSGSSAIGLGANLTSLSITALDSDKAGTARPSSGAWDAGAYQATAGGQPTPPTGLAAAVK